MHNQKITFAEVLSEAMIRANNHAEKALAFAAIGNKVVTPQIVSLAKHHAEAGAKIAAELFCAELREILISQRPLDASTPKRLAALANISPEDLANNRRARAISR